MGAIVAAAVIGLGLKPKPPRAGNARDPVPRATYPRYESQVQVLYRPMVILDRFQL